MKNKVLAVFLSVLMCLSCVNLLPVSAEDDVYNFPYATGLLWDPAEGAITQEELDAISATAQSTRAILPSKVDLSVDSAFPPIDSQGNINSCVGWSTTYYQFTYEVNKLRNLPSKKITTDVNGNIIEERIDENVYSPSWTYNYINHGANEISGIDDGYKVLKNQGAMKWADYPHEENIDNYTFAWSTDIKKMTEALEYRGVMNKFRVYNASYLTTVNDDFDISVKEKLANGHVATVTTDIVGWVQMKNEDGEEFVVCCGTGGSGHALAVVGYDDDIEITVNGVTLKGALKLANSYGTDWGNNGYIWVAYDALNPTSEFGTEWQNGGNELKTNNGTEYEAGDRKPVFGSDNQFRFINVCRCDITFAGYTKFSSTTNNISLYAQEGMTALNMPIHYSGDTTSESATTKYLVYDYFSLNSDACGNPVYSGDAYDLDSCLTSNWTVRVSDNSATHSEIRTANVRIIDNLSGVIAPQTAVTKFLTNGEISFTYAVNLAKGRVTSYDNNAFTTEDTALILDFITRKVEFSNLQIFLADYNNDGAVSLKDVTAMNSAIAARNGQSYVITDEVDGWGCSLADVIEEEYNMPIEQYVAENYAELSAMNVIPTEMKLALY